MPRYGENGWLGHEAPKDHYRCFVYMRIIERVKALLGGYYWIACPVCGEMFGGHEEQGHLETGPGHGLATCTACIEKASKMNEERANRLGPIVIDADTGRFLGYKNELARLKEEAEKL